MKWIKELLFGIQQEAVCDIKLGIRSVYPLNQPDEWTWKQEFRVGMLYDRKLIHFE